ncbi:hypothetical protein ACQPTN_32845 [Bradyrhizobium sp. 13971]
MAEDAGTSTPAGFNPRRAENMMHQIAMNAPVAVLKWVGYRWTRIREHGRRDNEASRSFSALWSKAINPAMSDAMSSRRALIWSGMGRCVSRSCSPTKSAVLAEAELDETLRPRSGGAAGDEAPARRAVRDQLRQ